jgi:hypothetical protein
MFSFVNVCMADILYFKMAAIENKMLNIYGFKPPNLLILVSNSTFSWTRNPLRVLLIILAGLVKEYELYIGFILVSRPIWSGSRSPLKALVTHLANLVEADKKVLKCPPIELVSASHIYA